MSLSKISKELDKIRDLRLQDKQCSREIILLSDSKGDYIKRQLSSSEQKNLEIISVKGATANSPRLKQLLFEKTRSGSSPIVIVWLGTCELTEKDNRKIKIRNYSGLSDHGKITKILENYCTLKASITEQLPKAKVIFLECPYYSISRWNNEENSEQDNKLRGLIDKLNSEIQQFNSIPTPRLSQDQLLSSKKKGKNTRYRVNYCTLRDGIHPAGTTAKLWGLKILQLGIKIAES